MSAAGRKFLSRLPFSPCGHSSSIFLWSHLPLLKKMCTCRKPARSRRFLSGENAVSMEVSGRHWPPSPALAKLCGPTNTATATLCYLQRLRLRAPPPCCVLPSQSLLERPRISEMSSAVREDLTFFENSLSKLGTTCSA